MKNSISINFQNKKGNISTFSCDNLVIYKLKLLAIGIAWVWFFNINSSAQTPLLQKANLEQSIADSLAKKAEFQEAILHAQKCINLLNRVQPVPYQQLVKANRKIGYYYRKLGDYHNCESYQKKAIDLAERGLPKNHIERMHAYNAMGIFLLGTGDYKGAKKNFLIALSISRNQFPEEAANHLNNLGIANERLGLYADAMKNYTESLTFNKRQFGLYSVQTTNNFINLGTLAYNTGNVNEAISYFDSTLMVYDSILPENDIEFASLFNNIGTTYHRKGDLHKALEYLYKAQALMENNYGPNHPDLAHTYTNIALLHFERGDLGQAITYLNRVLQIRADNFSTNHPLLAKTHHYLSMVLLEKGDLDSAYDELLKAKKTYDQTENYDPKEYAQVLSEFGTYFEKKNNTKLALSYYQKALDLVQQLNQTDPTEIATYLRKIGALYAQQKRKRDALEHLEKSLATFEKAFGKVHPEVGLTLNDLAKAYEDVPSRSIEYLKKSAMAFGYEPGSFEFQNLNAPVSLARTLQNWVDFELNAFEKSGNKQHLLNAQIKSLEALALIKQITSYEAASRQTLLDNFFKVYELAILTEYYLWQLNGKSSKYLEQAFGIAEQSNATLLVEALRAVGARHFAGIPDSILQKERELKIDISYLEKSLFQESLKGKDVNASKVKTFYKELFEKKRAYNILKHQMESNYPAYYKLRYEAPTVRIADLQRRILKKGENLISFFTGEENLFVFVINKDSTAFLKIAKDFPLETWVEEFCNSIYNFNPADNGNEFLIQKFNNIGNELYNLVFHPLEPYLSGNILIIIPSGILGYLPFEALLTKAHDNINNFIGLSYLIKQYQISYNYSATQFFETATKKNFGKNKVQFAPSYRSDTLRLNRQSLDLVLYDLKYNREEAAAVNELIGGRIYVDSQATKDAFLQEGPGARMIHLATHGKANDENGEFSFLAFYPIQNKVNDELLFVKDLYNLELDADLVVLSACETGIGEYQRGEGILSLSRGFLYAGAGSIVTTLWSIDDRASSQILKSFYVNLKTGQPKDKALRNAKLAFLKKFDGSLRSHPLFWAAFVPVGKMDPIQDGGTTTWYWLGGLLLAFATFFVYRRSARRRNNN